MLALMVVLCRRPLRCRRISTAVIALGITITSSLACGDEIVFPEGALPRDRSIDVAYRLDRPVKGLATLAIEWTDALGRVVERRKMRVHFNQTKAVSFRLDLRRAVAMENHLSAHLSFTGVTAAGAPDLRENEAEASFVTQPAGAHWSDYQIVMWQKRTPQQYAALKSLGITAGTVLANRGDQPADYVPSQIAPLIDSNLRWYVENIATDFYSAYHRWSPDHSENWRFLEAKKRYRANPNDRSALSRDPSLSDPAWLKRIHDRLIDTVRSQHRYRPLYYSLGDETGIADLSSFWDFDLSDDSLRAMRSWLRQQYPNLAALNVEWGTDFKRWTDVVPTTTHEAVHQAGENFSAWADFKAWMDVAFAQALLAGTTALHSADHSAYSAIEGAQIPGWGGYDYSRLATSVDAMELYDYGDNIDIAHSFNPKLAILTSHSGAGDAEIHRTWRELLLGSRGLILWDPSGNFAREDGTRGPAGEAAAPFFSEATGGLGALLINSEPASAPVAILYSPASERIRWILDRRPEGDAWTDRTAETEYEDNAARAARRRYVDLVEHIGIPHRFLSPARISRGDLVRGGFKVLMLPDVVSLSREQAEQIRRFVGAGGLIVTDTEPGTFDEHGRKLAHPLLRDLFRNASERASASAVFDRGRVARIPIPQGNPGRSSTPCVDRASLDPAIQLLAAAGVAPTISLRSPAGDPPTDIRSFVFRDGRATILALLRDDCAAVADLARTDGRQEEAIRLTLPRGPFVYDIRARRALGRKHELEIALGPTAPVILAMSDTPLPSIEISGPRQARPGDRARFRVALPEAGALARHVIHIEVHDPKGNLLSHYSGNLGPVARWADLSLPLALNDPVGVWRILATDVLTGSSATWELLVVDRQRD